MAKNSVRAGSLPILALLAAGGAHGGGSPVLMDFEGIEAYVREHPSARLEDVLHRLSPEIRSRYQLVYQSRSPNGASLENPRIVLSNGDGTLLLGLTSDPQMANGQVLEVIEYDRSRSRLRFRKVDFGVRPPEVPRETPECMQCHGNPRAKRGYGRPIWDGYPDWPGAFGSAHNNLRYGRRGGGTSQMPDFEFEARALDRLRARAGASPRLSALIGFPETTLAGLAKASGEFTRSLISLHFLNLIGALHERADAIFRESPARYREIRDRVLGLTRRYPAPTPISETLTLESVRKRWLGHYRKKRDRVRKLVERHGTANDLEAFRFDRADLDLGGEAALASLRMTANGPEFGFQLAQTLEAFDLDPEGGSIVREGGAAVFNSPQGTEENRFLGRLLELLGEDGPATLERLRCREYLHALPVSAGPGR